MSRTIPVSDRLAVPRVDRAVSPPRALGCRATVRLTAEALGPIASPVALAVDGLEDGSLDSLISRPAF